MDIMYMIMSYLRDHRDIGSMMRTSKSLRKQVSLCVRSIEPDNNESVSCPFIFQFPYLQCVRPFILVRTFHEMVRLAQRKIERCYVVSSLPMEQVISLYLQNSEFPKHISFHSETGKLHCVLERSFQRQLYPDQYGRGRYVMMTASTLMKCKDVLTTLSGLEILTIGLSDSDATCNLEGQDLVEVCQSLSLKYLYIMIEQTGMISYAILQRAIQQLFKTMSSVASLHTIGYLTLRQEWRYRIHLMADVVGNVFKEITMCEIKKKIQLLFPFHSSDIPGLFSRFGPSSLRALGFYDPTLSPEAVVMYPYFVARDNFEYYTLQCRQERNKILQIVLCHEECIVILFTLFDRVKREYDSTDDDDRDILEHKRIRKIKLITPLIT